jgi:4-amino-4-deoxy-L-arabinose transferase-like glycosyltransferase
MLISLVFGYLVFLWAKKLYGVKAGILALLLYAFNTAIIAHSRFVTTDMGVSFTFFLNVHNLGW